MHRITTEPSDAARTYATRANLDAAVNKLLDPLVENLKSEEGYFRVIPVLLPDGRHTAIIQVSGAASTVLIAVARAGFTVIN